MERMTSATMTATELEKYIGQLEEENKNLKEEVKKWKMVADENGTHYDMLEEENKKLRKENEELKEYKSMYEGLCK